jgi:RHS repeat-associated protein
MPRVVPYGVRQSYNATGYLSQVTEAATGSVHWQATGRYDDGQAYQSQVGGLLVTRGYDTLARVNSIATPGVQNSTFAFDYLGNLTTRGDTRGDGLSYSETFTYDALNRIVTETCTNAAFCASPHTFAYNDFGSLTSKTGVTGITLATNSHRLAMANGRSYSYDAAGNVTGDGITTVGWTPFNMPDRISKSGAQLDFRYDAGHARTVEQWSQSSSLLVLYVGNQFFEQQINGGVTTAKLYLGSPDGIIGVVTLDSQGAVANRRYWYKDHLGSVIAERDSGTAGVTYLAFDEWGSRRGTYNPAAESTTRGFTGHEHLDAFTLVHMNGRIYDPAVGRFLSADPQIQDPFNPQNYNRYAYVLNNPLSLTDPTGFSWWTSWGRTAFKTVGAIAAAVIGQQWIVAEMIASYTAAWAPGEVVAGGLEAATQTANAVGAIAGGFAAGGIQGGNIQSALAGAAGGALFFAAGSVADSIGGEAFKAGNIGRVGLHAVAGCASSAAAGGSCGKGAASAGFAEAAGPYIHTTNFEYNVAASAVAGGVGSVLAGGKFANGALTGAFGYLFNQAAHPGARAAYGETSGLYPQLVPGARYVYDPANWDQASAAELQEARAWISEVESRNANVHSSQPRGNNPIEQRQWQLALDAEAMAGNLSPSDVRHFFIRQENVGVQAPGWAAGQTPYRSFGPFVNPGGGDVPRGPNTYIEFYRGIR